MSPVRTWSLAQKDELLIFNSKLNIFNTNKFFFWASDGIWTRDLIPTKDALYQLSYTGLEKFERKSVI